MVVEVHEVEVGGVQEPVDCRARRRDPSRGSDSVIAPSPLITVTTSLLLCTSERNRCSLRSSSAVRSWTRSSRCVVSDRFSSSAATWRMTARIRSARRSIRGTVRARLRTPARTRRGRRRARPVHTGTSTANLSGTSSSGLWGSASVASHRRGEEDRCERAEPADVDEAARGVRPAVRQEHEPAVSHREGEQPGEEHQPARPAERLPLPSVGRREQQDRDDDDVTEWVGEPDRQRETGRRPPRGAGRGPPSSS